MASNNYYMDDFVQIVQEPQFNVSQYKYCGQIHITHIRKCRDLYKKLFKQLNQHYARFGRIVKLKVLAQGNTQLENNQKSTVAFLQYVRSASHWEAIDFFNNHTGIFI
jgi:hypothetical protein